MVHSFVSYVEKELDEASKNLKDIEQSRRVRENKFRMIMERPDSTAQSFGPKEAMILENTPPTPGVFKDPRDLFSKKD